MTRRFRILVAFCSLCGALACQSRRARAEIIPGLPTVSITSAMGEASWNAVPFFNSGDALASFSGPEFTIRFGPSIYPDYSPQGSTEFFERLIPGFQFNPTLEFTTLEGSTRSYPAERLPLMGPITTWSTDYQVS